jgi:hypothetical protein
MVSTVEVTSSFSAKARTTDGIDLVGTKAELKNDRKILPPISRTVRIAATSVLFDQRGEDSDNRRLARAVGVKQGENLTSLHFKIDALGLLCP